MESRIFRAYDIRGIFGEDLTPEIMLKIGRALAALMDEEGMGNTVLVAHDVRGSGQLLSGAFLAGVLAGGVDVTWTGRSPIGLAAFSGLMLKRDVMAYITASHLPPEWNGIKFYSGKGIGFSAEYNMRIGEMVADDESLMKRSVPWDAVGVSDEISMNEEYTRYLASKFDIEGVRTVMDCGGGSMSIIAPHVCRKLGISAYLLFSNRDPKFTHRASEPTKESLKVLMGHTKKLDVDFGVAFDGDGDRGVIVDDKGRLLTPEQTGIIIAKEMLQEKGSGKVVANVECSRAIEDQLEPLGAKVSRIPVGHTYLTLEAEKQKAMLGIESSGHMVMPEYFLFDDAILIPLKIAEICSKSKKKLSEMVDEIPIYPKERIDMTCLDECKFSVMDSLKETFSASYDKINTFGGLRIDLDEGWALVRASNTSPTIRLTVEARREEDLGTIAEPFTKAIREKIKEEEK
ncbi:MAG: hypothetical protein ACXQS6_05380 [Candidatus Syntropharchaeales archaeon]|nr:hypothetical protein [Candidatus Syntrophoarchaeum sp.]